MGTTATRQPLNRQNNRHIPTWRDVSTPPPATEAPELTRRDSATQHSGYDEILGCPSKSLRQRPARGLLLSFPHFVAHWGGGFFSVTQVSSSHELPVTLRVLRLWQLGCCCWTAMELSSPDAVIPRLSVCGFSIICQCGREFRVCELGADEAQVLLFSD